MKSETKVEFGRYKWGIKLIVFRVYWKGKEIRDKLDIIFYLNFGLGNIANMFAKGIWFYFDMLRFGVSERWRAKFGFTIPMRKSLQQYAS